jgi:hypothetical protein
MFSLIYDDGGGDASPLETRVDITPPQAVFTVLEFETFYKLSKFFIHDNSHHEALVKIFDIRSELVDMVQRDDGIYARMVRVAAAGNTSQVKFSRAFGIVDDPSALLSKWSTSTVSCASLATLIHPERHPTLALDPTSLSLRRQMHRWCIAVQQHRLAERAPAPERCLRCLDQQWHRDGTIGNRKDNSARLVSHAIPWNSPRSKQRPSTTPNRTRRVLCPCIG